MGPDCFLGEMVAVPPRPLLFGFPDAFSISRHWQCCMYTATLHLLLTLQTSALFNQLYVVVPQAHLLVRVSLVVSERHVGWRG